MKDNKEYFHLVRTRLDKYYFIAFDKDQVARLMVSVIYDNKPLSHALRYHSLPISRRQSYDILIKRYEDDYTSSDIKVLLAKEYDKIRSTTVISTAEMIAKIAREYHVSKYAPRRYSRLMRQKLIW